MMTITSPLQPLVRTMLIAVLMTTSVHAKQMYVALDISRSNPLFTDKAINAGASRYIDKRMASIRIKDVVTLGFIGSLTDTQSLQKFENTITHQNKGMVKKMASQLVQAAMMQITPQGSTNLIAYFNNHQFDCANGGEVIVLTDGIEASEYINPNDLLLGKGNLPKPSEFVSLKGCTVTFYGIGAKRSDTEKRRLRKQWQGYFDAMGATFKAIPL